LGNNIHHLSKTLSIMQIESFTPIIYHNPLSIQASKQTSYTWLVSNTKPFDELLLSWNAHRPLQGHYVILSSISFQNKWSPWLLYAVWGAQDQFSFHDTTPHAPVHSFQDQVEMLENKTASGFRIRIEACGGATLDHFYHLYACISTQSNKPIWAKPHDSFPPLTVPGLSQLCLNHPRAKSFCSPTSTTSVIQYILGHTRPNPLDFAKNVYDAGFDIYGNWSFNVAQAFVELGAQWQCYYARTEGFSTICQYLKKNLPVVVSIKGTLTGSPLPYSNGHLIVIRGYEANTHQVLCMDPAFPSNEQTMISYQWEEFMQAWKSRNHLGYFFFPLCQNGCLSLQKRGL
jgi:hypothetical protein